MELQLRRARRDTVREPRQTDGWARALSPVRYARAVCPAAV